MFTLFESIVLGIIQGLTEFLPISSSAHQRIVGEFFGNAQASAQQDKKESPDKEAEEDAKVEPGQMTPQQARQILDAQKSDENMLPLDVPSKPRDSSRPFKDW